MATYTSIFAQRLRKALAAVKFGIRSSETQADADVPLLSSGSGAPSASEPNGSIYTRTGAAGLYQRVGGAWVNNSNADAIAYDDDNGSLVATTVNGALDELSTPLTLTAGAEATNVIDITVAGPAHVAQYIAQVYTAAMLEAVAANFTLAETGAGAEVSTTGNPSLLFTTSAAGAATLSVTDAMGASGATVYVEVRPASASAGTKAGPAAIAAITFD